MIYRPGDMSISVVALIVGLSMLFYAINLDVVSLFADSSFMFLTMLNVCLYLIYFISLNELISF
jgi:hypothetical protein